MPSQSMTFDVIGIPVPQGSMVSNGHGRGLRYSNDKPLKMWRNQLISEMVDNRPEDWDPNGALTVSAVFRFVRPKSHFGTGRNAGVLKPSAPEFHMVKPDGDKLLRSVFDSVAQAGLAGRGDQSIVSANTTKRWVIGDEPPGVLLTINSVSPNV